MSSDNLVPMDKRLDEFLAGVEEYITNNKLEGPEFNEDFKAAESLSFDELSELTQDECFVYGYSLLQFAEYVNGCRSRLQTSVNWCDRAVADIVAREYGNTDQYAKYDIKVAQIAQDNPVLSSILDWRMTAQGRMESLINKEYNLKRKAECLIERGKRK